MKSRIMASRLPGSVPRRSARPSEEELAAYWAEWEQLAAEIGKKWPEGVSAADGVRDIRREL